MEGAKQTRKVFPQKGGNKKEESSYTCSKPVFALYTKKYKFSCMLSTHFCARLIFWDSWYLFPSIIFHTIIMSPLTLSCRYHVPSISRCCAYCVLDRGSAYCVHLSHLYRDFIRQVGHKKPIIRATGKMEQLVGRAGPKDQHLGALSAAGLSADSLGRSRALFYWFHYCCH